MNYLAYLLTTLKQKRIQIWILIVWTCLSYINIFGNGFAWDDKDTVLNWQAKREWSSIPRFILGETPPTHLGNYRPIRNILYIVADKIWGTHPFGYHLQTIAIMLTIVLLVYLITRRISNHPYVPFLTALLFAVHPIHVEAVTWITSSMDMIGIVFMLASLYGYIRVSEHPNHRWLYQIGSVFLALLAFGTNEVTLTLPGLIILFDWYFLYKKDPIWMRLVRNIPYALMLAIYLALRMFIAQAGARSGFLLHSPRVQFFVMLRAFLVYLRLLVAPIGLTINHSLGDGITSWAVEIERSSQLTKRTLQMLSMYNWQSILAVTCIVTSLVVAVRTYKKAPILSFAIAWFYISFLTTLNIIPTEAVMVERFVFVPSYGFILAAVYLFSTHFSLLPSAIQTRRGKLSWGIIILIVLCLSWLTIQRNFDWKDDQTLWERTVSVNPNVILVRLYLANLYLEKNRLDEGLYHYEQAYRSNPDYPEIPATLGLLYDAKGDHAKAIEMLSRSSRHTTNDLERFLLLANAYRQLSKYDLAIDAYKKALEISPRDTSILNNLGAVYAMTNQFSQAQASFEAALAIDPQMESAKINLAKLKSGLKK